MAEAVRTLPQSMMDRYLDRHQARELLGEMGIILNDRQMRRALEPDAYGVRKIPAFQDPITGVLRISERQLRAMYAQACGVPQNAPQAQSGRRGQR